MFWVKFLVIKVFVFRQPTVIVTLGIGTEKAEFEALNLVQQDFQRFIAPRTQGKGKYPFEVGILGIL
jgi:hypothetical protein